MFENLKEISPNLLSYGTIAAVFGFLAKSLYDLLIQRRKENLEYINNQIEKLYGPLFILDSVGTASYNTFIKRIGRESDPQLEKPLSQIELEEWVVWVKDIFMPLNLEKEKIIKSNPHLLIEKSTPKPILDFISHVTVYKIVIKRWGVGDFKEIYSLIDYPSDFSAYITDSYNVLKTKQESYLKKLKI